MTTDKIGCGKEMGYRHESGAKAYCGEDVGTHIIYCKRCKSKQQEFTSEVDKMTDIFTAEIETLKKGCKNYITGKNVNGYAFGCNCGNGRYCPTCQAKLETAQKLKLTHDNEIDKLKQEELEFLKSIETEPRFWGNDRYEQEAIKKRISKLKSELK